MAYSPKYITESDVPVQIPDDYSSQEKLDAIEYAESMLELRLNDGAKIPSNLVDKQIRAAVKQKSTCELAKGSEHPDDVALGDLEDAGDTKVDYSIEAFCNRFDEIIDAILDAGGIDPDSEKDSSMEPFTYTTSKPDDGCDDCHHVY